MRVRQWGGTEDLRIIASISWGCVGDGNGGISQCSSQSNGIYVQHSGLQPGNKCLSFPCTHFDFLSSFNSVSLSSPYLQYSLFSRLRISVIPRPQTSILHFFLKPYGLLSLSPSSRVTCLRFNLSLR